MASGSRAAFTPGVRTFLCACIFCLGIHFLVNDLAVFNLNVSARPLAGKSAALRTIDNDHQEDGFLKDGLNLRDGFPGLTQPIFNQPVYASQRAISPLYPPPKA
jgi:hypothetical protein